MELIKMRKTFLFVAVLAGMVFGLSGSALAQKCDPKDPKCEPPKEGDCSPGFYKNHTDFWFGIYCDDSTSECSDLLAALTCKGADATCGRSAAAAHLNALSGCTE
jgi:hypothetical protein